MPATAALDLLDTLTFHHRFSIFLSALEQAGLVHELRAAGPFTLLAPTDAAISRLPAQTWRDLLRPGNEELLYDILTYHVIPGEVRVSDLRPGQELITLGGQHLRGCQDRQGEICLDRAHIIQGDIVCANGILHAIDKVLLPGIRD